MQFILGLLTAIVLFLLLATAFYLGRRQANKQIRTIPIDEEETRRIKAYNDHFKALFSYDVEKAIARKKVR